MKLDFHLIIIVIGIMFAISLPATYSEIQSNSNQILQEDGTIIQKQIQYSNHALAIGRIDSITKNGSPAKITLVVKYSDHVRIGYSLLINAKVFYANQNPTGNFDQYYGFIPNSKITVQILDPNGVLVKSFTGVTDNHGYYYQTFRIPDNSRLGTYSILISAQTGDSVDSKKLILFIQHRSY
ncbi:MAG: hypothetical protein HY222_07170 [Thaumarchaeota archaeon]|nr:hypothetical protein [Nitrososphaerota archaeon]MBI3642156.1 hypothetical protein [Nitrososphaerota archaeon]